MDTRSQLVKIATKVRDWAEGWNAERDLFGNDLCGMCAIASGRLHDVLTTHGFEPLIVVSEKSGGCHCFILCDGYIVDITATQFPQFQDTPVVVLAYNHRNKSKLRHYNNPTYILENTNQLKVYQRTEDWEENEICL